ncbi:MAG: hypothetical protein M3248_07055 [Actinomycetota bacterium]|nr:hypothetical protein [Actinomycetota bacterium]
MKRLVYLAVVALVAMMILIPSAFAQGTAKIEQTIETTVLQPTGGGAVGGPAVVLPAATALLLGSGVLAYAVLRRRR